VLYVWDRRDVLRAFLFSGERLQESPSQTGNLASEMVGGISLSSRGSMPGTGIVWATTAAENGNQAIVHGTLRAYDAANIQHELWNSDLLTERDSMGNFTKFASPVVANGKVYVVTQSNQLQVYGLLSNTSVVSQ
jgi:outer membrane protein assembly factor BamB